MERSNPFPVEDKSIKGKIFRLVEKVFGGKASLTTPSWEEGTKGMTQEQKKEEERAFKERLGRYVPK